jgi:transposase-like protein
VTGGWATASLVGFEEEPMNDRRKITDEREARRCLAAASKTGERVGAWARANGIDGRSLNAWRMNLARRGSRATSARRATRPPTATVVRPPPRAALVELVPASRPGVAARYAVHVGEFRVEVGDDFAAEALQRILEVLRAC